MTTGIWGTGKDQEKYRSGDAVVHWFDGAFLASFLVSSGQFIDPVNRRPLSIGECASLDEYLEAHALPPVHVEDAYKLSKKVAASQQGATNSASNALQREAASILRNLFSFRSSSVPLEVTAGTRRSKIGPRTTPDEQPSASLGEDNGAQLGRSDQSEAGGSQATSRTVVRRWQGASQQRTVHREAGLT
eukprot:5007347-Amphidinium_carterae.1